MFDTTKTNLTDLLAQAHSGKLQLPDFQRSYVWDEDDVRGLIASIVKGFPVGALLLLENGGIAFKTRGVEGTSVDGVVPETLLLDGQQRITSLYQAVHSPKPAQMRTAKGRPVLRYFYIDIADALNEATDFAEAIKTVNAERVTVGAFGAIGDLDLSTPDKEFERLMFPLNQAGSPTAWILACVQHWMGKGDNRMELLMRFEAGLLKKIQHYAMPIIRLDRENSREAVCTVFEKVNVEGKKLDAFELVTAIFAADGYLLREDWWGTRTKKGRLDRIRGELPKRGVFADLASTDFLQACTLLHTRELRAAEEQIGKVGKELPPVSCTREALMRLPRATYERYAPAVEAGFIEAGKFLMQQKILFGRDLPYPPQVVALAAFFAIAGAKVNAAEREKLGRWFWSGVLGEYYGSATETKIARDVPELLAWMKGGPAPRTWGDTYFQVDRLDSLRIRISAAYKGLHALLMRAGCRDFMTGNSVELMTVFEDDVDIHHIFPRKWCEAHGIAPGVFNTIVNKTALSKMSNQSIGGNAPSKYIAQIEHKTGLSSAALDDILRTHLIEPAHLRADNFDAFYAARKTALAGLTTAAQGKEVVQGAEIDEAAANDPFLDEEDSSERDFSSNEAA